jgi:hypothetical protein
LQQVVQGAHAGVLPAACCVRWRDVNNSQYQQLVAGTGLNCFYSAAGGVMGTCRCVVSSQLLLNSNLTTQIAAHWMQPTLSECRVLHADEISAAVDQKTHADNLV